jgi:hypothetical protein
MPQFSGVGEKSPARILPCLDGFLMSPLECGGGGSERHAANNTSTGIEANARTLTL